MEGAGPEPRKTGNAGQWSAGWSKKNAGSAGMWKMQAAPKHLKVPWSAGLLFEAGVFFLDHVVKVLVGVFFVNVTPDVFTHGPLEQLVQASVVGRSV